MGAPNNECCAVDAVARKGHAIAHDNILEFQQTKAMDSSNSRKAGMIKCVKL